MIFQKVPLLFSGDGHRLQRFPYKSGQTYWKSLLWSRHNRGSSWWWEWFKSWYIIQIGTLISPSILMKWKTSLIGEAEAAGNLLSLFTQNLNFDPFLYHLNSHLLHLTMCVYQMTQVFISPFLQYTQNAPGIFSFD